MIYVLDSSALVAHALNASGAAEVQSLLDDESNEILLSALSLFELAGCLKLHNSAGSIPAYWEAYRAAMEIIPVDADLTESAWELRESVGQRIPIVDAVIAATARRHGATLVHRDQHLALIPVSLLPQTLLPSS